MVAKKKAPSVKSKTSAAAKKKATAPKKSAQPRKEAVNEPPIRPAPPVGKPAPSFSLLSDDDSTVTLASLRGRPVVLYFYPKDDTPGCTIEACAFRDAYREIQKKGAVVLGVSRDTVAKHKKFKDKYQLPFLLLSDPTGEVISAYGSWGPKQFMGRKFNGILRTTFLIGADGVIKKVYPKVSPKTHADEILSDLGAL